MSDNDLIRRGDALAACQGMDPEGDINAIHAVQPTVKPLVWESHPMGWIAGAMFGPAYIIDVRIKGRVMFIKGMNPPPQFDDLEAAKAAAQADYEARILSALDMQPTVSPDVIEIDLRSVMIERIEEAAAQSPWVPPEYAMNEIISDCCSFLREPRDPSPDVAALERILRERGAVFDAMVDAAEDAAGKDVSFNVVIGRALRAALARVKGVM